MRPWPLFSAIAIAGIIVDQLTKIAIDRSMKLFDSITIIEHFFHITYVRNKGAAFSFLSNASWRLPFFIAVSIIAALIILVAFRKLRDDQKLAHVSLAMIFSGAVGNLIDRLRMGEVIDFLDAHWYQHHWPAFNVADSMICIGVFLLALDMILEEKRMKAETQRH